VTDLVFGLVLGACSVAAAIGLVREPARAESKWRLGREGVLLSAAGVALGLLGLALTQLAQATGQDLVLYAAFSYVVAAPVIYAWGVLYAVRSIEAGEPLLGPKIVTGLWVPMVVIIIVAWVWSGRL